MNQAGDVIAVWRRAGIVQAAVRPAGEAFSQHVDLTAAGEDANAPQVAVAQTGEAIVVWEKRANDGSSILQAAVRPAGGAFSAAVGVSVAGQDVFEPQVAMDQAGDAVTVWQSSSNTGVTVQAAVRAAGGAFSAPVDLSVGGRAFFPQVAIDDAGDAVAVWEILDDTGVIVQAAVRPAGGSFSAPVNVAAAGPNVDRPQVAINQAGDAVAVWVDSSGENSVRAAVRPAGGSFSAPVNVSATSESAFEPQVALDQAGDAVVVWRGFSDTRWIVRAAVRAAGGSVLAPVNVSATDQNAQAPRVAMDPTGDAVVAWESPRAANTIVQAAVRSAAGAFSPPVDLSAADARAFSPQVAMDQAGDAVAVFERFSGTDVFVRAVGYDAAAPQLRALNVPAAGVVGSPVSFSLSPLDVWSPLADTSWVFGDGTAATGTAPTHTYAAPGTFTVAVSAADTLANRATATRSISIAPAPPPSGSAGSGAPRKPAVTGLRLSPSTFRAASSGPSVKTAAPRTGARITRTGTRVSYSLNVAASVRATFQRATSGRRVGRRCLKASRANRTRRPCPRFARVTGSFARARPAGADRFTFTGRIAGRALSPGRYRLLATPTANARTGVTTSASFRIIKKAQTKHS
jgi:PKD domain-containing protein